MNRSDGAKIVGPPQKNSLDPPLDLWIVACLQLKSLPPEYFQEYPFPTLFLVFSQHKKAGSK